MKLWWDLETYCETPIQDGSHRYAENAEILLFAWAVDDTPVSVWDLTESKEIPPELELAMHSCSEYWGHNSAMFDRVVLKHARKDVFARMPEERHRDTLVQALCHGLPGSLGTLCDIFNLSETDAKDKRGKQLIQLFCKPRPSSSKVRRYTKENHPAEWEEFKIYAKSDIVSMRILQNKMPKWNYPNNENELKLWQLDQKINGAGICMDIDLAKSAIAAVDTAQEELRGKTVEATNGEVGSATRRDALLKFMLKEHGVSLPDMRSSTLEKRLDDPNIPEPVKELLRIRLMASTSSVSKYKRVINSSSSDGYLRGVIQFCGAGRTGRDAGRLFQPQNLMRPTMKNADIEFGIETIKNGTADLFTDNVMGLCANAMRGVIIAPKGQKMVVADLSNIEGRVIAWLAEEEWKLQAFRDYDAGTGPDLYLASYAKAFGVPIEKAQRQIGKVLELAMGFGGGVGSFVSFAAIYGLDLAKMTDSLVIPNDVAKEAENFWTWSVETKRNIYGLSQEVFIACESLKRLWRRAHPKTASLWSDLQNDAICAAANEGKEYVCRRLKLVRKGNWLRMILPSGRSVSYAGPKLEDGRVTYMGMNQYTRKWERIGTHGGKLVENATQAAARDVFKSCYPAAMDAGYRIVLPVHDELVTYAPDDDGHSPEHLATIMSDKPAWAQDLPLSAAGFQGYRYRKD